MTMNEILMCGSKLIICLIPCTSDDDDDDDDDDEVF